MPSPEGYKPVSLAECIVCIMYCVQHMLYTFLFVIVLNKPLEEGRNACFAVTAFDSNLHANIQLIQLGCTGGKHKEPGNLCGCHAWHRSEAW